MDEVYFIEILFVVKCPMWKVNNVKKFRLELHKSRYQTSEHRFGYFFRINMFWNTETFKIW